MENKGYDAEREICEKLIGKIENKAFLANRCQHCLYIEECTLKVSEK